MAELPVPMIDSRMPLSHDSDFAPFRQGIVRHGIECVRQKECLEPEFKRRGIEIGSYLPPFCSSSQIRRILQPIADPTHLGFDVRQLSEDGSKARSRGIGLIRWRHRTSTAILFLQIGCNSEFINALGGKPFESPCLRQESPSQPIRYGALADDSGKTRNRCSSTCDSDISVLAMLINVVWNNPPFE